MDKLRWMPEEEAAESTIIASGIPGPPGVDSDGSSFNNNASAEMDEGMAMMEESMENEPEDQPPLGSDDEEQVYIRNSYISGNLNNRCRKIRRITARVATIPYK